MACRKKYKKIEKPSLTSRSSGVFYERLWKETAIKGVEMGARKRKVSIYDIAREAGFSATTVSRVLNNSPNVNEETRELVRKTFERRKYKPKVVRNKIPNICMMLEDCSDGSELNSAYSSELCEGVARYSERHNLHFTLVRFNSELYLEPHDMLVHALRCGADGVITHFCSNPLMFLEMFIRNNFPYAIINMDADLNGLNSVNVDNKGGMETIVAYLRSLGHEKIAYAKLPKEDFDYAQRREAFKRALNSKGVSFSPERDFLICSGKGNHADLGYEAIRREYADKEPFHTAIVCEDDDVALGVMKAFHDYGIKVPEGISVTGFGDYLKNAKYMLPALTTVNQSVKEMGERACELVHRRLNGTIKNERLILPVSLTIRESCTGNLKTR